MGDSISFPNYEYALFPCVLWNAFLAIVLQCFKIKSKENNIKLAYYQPWPKRQHKIVYFFLGPKVHLGWCRKRDEGVQPPWAAKKPTKLLYNTYSMGDLFSCNVYMMAERYKNTYKMICPFRSKLLEICLLGLIYAY